MAVEHDSITDPEIHEMKGAAAATSGQVPIANGAGSAPFTTHTWTSTKFGFWDYNDLTTATTPISLPLAATDYELTNDGAGTFTNKTYALSGVADVWNVATNRFDFSNLSLGDTVDIRFDIEWTTANPNDTIQLNLELAVGGSPYTIPIITPTTIKTASATQQVSFNGVYMGDNNTLNNPARLLAQCDGTGSSIKVNGWYVRVLTNG